jgi:hypothetical protein
MPGRPYRNNPRITPGGILKDILPREKVFVIGIEPGNTDFSLALSPKVEAAVRLLACALRDGSWIRIPGAQPSYRVNRSPK